MSGESAVFPDSGVEEFQQYRAVSKAAVASFVLGIVSLAGLLFPSALMLPLLGFILGLLAYRAIRRYPNELVGKPLAVIGAVSCFALFTGGMAFHVHEYLTELPEGYERVSFFALKSPAGKPDVPPDEALELDGKRVFIKGYMYPDGQRSGIRQFVLVPDLGTCCFGGQPKLTHMIEVKLEYPLDIDYSMRKRKLAGTLRVDRSLKPVNELGGVYYQLLADYAK